MKSKNISFQLSFYFLISETILSVFVILFGYSYVRNSFLESYRYRLQYDVQEVLDSTRNSMNETVRFANNLKLDITGDYLKKNPQEYFEIIFREQINMYAFGMVTSPSDNLSNPKSGFMLLRSGEGLKSITEKFHTNSTEINSWIAQMPGKSQPQWSTPFYDPEINSRLMVYAQPFDYEKGGRLLHTTIFCTISLDRGLQSLKHQKLIKSGLTIILDEHNNILYHPDSTKTGKEVSSLVEYFGIRQFDIAKLSKDRIPGYQNIQANSLRNNGKVAIYWPIISTKWFLISIIPENFYMSELKQMTLVLILLILFIGSITTAAAIYFSSRFFSPITVLADDSRKIMEEAGFNPVPEPTDSVMLSEREVFIRQRKTYPVSHLNDLKVLSDNMVKMKERLAAYRENSLQSSIDKEEMDKELMLARDIEMSMVPTKFPLFPERNDFECFGRLIPAKIVGGDLFDIFLLNDHQLFISISDTLGKGIPAAMFSVITRTFIRSIANPITRLGKIMESLNNELSLGLESDMFATVLLGKLNLITGEFIYCNAGHPHPFILRNDNREEVLTQSHGIPVGVKSNLKFSESRTVLARGESLFTFTDGVTEEYNEHGEFFGSERLISVVKPFYELSAQNIVNKTLDVLEKFRGKSETNDDTTLVAIKFTPN